jgi:hypothetical protein
MHYSQPQFLQILNSPTKLHAFRSERLIKHQPLAQLICCLRAGCGRAAVKEVKVATAMVKYTMWNCILFVGCRFLCFNFCPCFSRSLFILFLKGS